MSIAELLPTELRMEDLPERAWPREEIIDGSLHVTPLARAGHQFITTQLAIALARRAPEDLTVLAGVNVLRRGETDRLLIPDVAVIQRSALAENPVAVRPEDVYLAAEVISPSSRATDLYLKRELYAEWGVGSYWVLDPVARQVHRFGARDLGGGWLAGVDLEVWP